MLSESERYL
jgi:hypothetical protein